MANKTASDEIKAQATKIAEVLAANWEGVILRGTEDKKAQVQESVRAYSLALRSYLRAKGELKGAPRTGPSFDSANVLKAIYFTFCKTANTKNENAPDKNEVVYGTLAFLKVAPIDMPKALKAVESVLASSDRFAVALKVEGNPFKGAVVRLKGTPTPPEAFKSWDEMNAAPKAESPKAVANGKGKKGATAMA